jgi:cytochrome c-type biogenesis protein CcmH/NrfG
VPAGALAAVRSRLAETLADLQATGEAEELFRQELGRAPDDPRARFGLAQIALGRGDRAAARAAFAALADNPYTRKRAAGECAALARADGDLEAAGRFEARARRAPPDPSWPDPYLADLRKREVGVQGLLHEIETLVATGQRGRAAQLCLGLLDQNPKPLQLVIVGMHLARLGEIDRAEAVFRGCLRQDPNNAQANYFLSVVLFDRAHAADPRRRAERPALLREAIRLGRAAVATKPDHGTAWLYLGRALLATGDGAGAVEALSRAVALRPEVADTHLFLAEALAAAGAAAEARKSAATAAELAEPGDDRPRLLLDRLDQSRGTPKK